MPAHSGEIISQIVPRSVAMRRAHFFGADFVMKRRGSTAKCILRDGRTRRMRDKATRTDPQFLFSAAS